MKSLHRNARVKLQCGSSHPHFSSKAVVEPGVSIADFDFAKQSQGVTVSGSLWWRADALG